MSSAAKAAFWRQPSNLSVTSALMDDSAANRAATATKGEVAGEFDRGVEPVAKLRSSPQLVLILRSLTVSCGFDHEVLDPYWTVLSHLCLGLALVNLDRSKHNAPSGAIM